MKDAVIVVCFLCLAGAFFYANDIDRGEYGGWLYTSTKCAPILLLCLFSKLAMTGGTTLGRNTSLAMLLAAAGDLFLSTRSVSVQNFVTGLVPFGVSHYFHILSMRTHGGLTYWWLGAGPLVAHAVVVGVLTNGKFEFPAVQAFCSVYALMLMAVSFFSFSAWHYQPQRKSAKCRAFGYLMFCVSDTMLTVDAYVTGFAKAQVYTMITYYAAQLFICLGGYYLEQEVLSARRKAT